MNIGSFDRYIRIEKPIYTKNNFGEENVEWEILEEVYANKFERSNLVEKFEGNQKVSIIHTVFTIYYIEGITTKDRIVVVDTDEIYEIEGIKEINYKEGLQLYCYNKDRF